MKLQKKIYTYLGMFIMMVLLSMMFWIAVIGMMETP